MRQYQEYFVAEYGVKPKITVTVKDVTEDKAKEITKDLSKVYDLGGTMQLDTGSDLLYTTRKDGDISVFASYK
ncbi:hypothetical protein J7E81_01500 [Bacillus sp. ISL-18]|uniref:hypothetical protein n=1 Tax=Bacillus sp. ISL-18 TaxID=2819118 RepID=UPI001BEA06A3|nr:hypothetical protein [Bacillus sp. ISL-18]MBT2653921.1 hypothetical protein [Bacillus sp. ISL-18]